MHLIVCQDDRNGMAFNGRRLSRDQAVIAAVLRESAGHRLLAAPYSAALFSGGTAELRDDYPTAAGPEDFCFDEREDPAPFAGRITAVTVYRWNRHYPSDLRFRLELSGWRRMVTEEFPGSSHEKITREVYVP